MNISNLDAIEETVSDTFLFSSAFIDNVLLGLLRSDSIGLMIISRHNRDAPTCEVQILLFQASSLTL